MTTLLNKRSMGKKGNLALGGMANKIIYGLVALILLFAILGSGIILTVFSQMTNFTTTMTQVDSSGIGTAIAIILPILLVIGLFGLAIVAVTKIGK